MAAANLRAVSNDHLLTGQPRLARRLSNVQVGDQNCLTGQLVSYSHNAGFAFTRGTSTTRGETGNGACKTLFVHHPDLLAFAPGWPRAFALDRYCPAGFRARQMVHGAASTA